MKHFLHILLAAWIIPFAVADMNQQPRRSFDDVFFAAGCVTSTPQYVAASNAWMTADDEPAGYATSASSILDTPYAAWKAFDGDTNTLWHSNTYSDPYWLQYEFKSGMGIIATNYAIFGRHDGYLGSPTAWTFSGWSGADWVILDTQTNLSTWSSGEIRSFNFENSTSYEKYRLDMFESADNYYMHIGEMTIRGTRLQ
jgi:hypothetical protein